jgi:hypothetical protein
VRIEDVELGQSYTEYRGPVLALGPGESSVEDPSVLGERISLIHPCLDENGIRLLEALVECPKCGTAFSSEYQGEGLVTEAHLRVDWETLYDGRLRAWIVGTQIVVGLRPASASLSAFARPSSCGSRAYEPVVGARSIDRRPTRIPTCSLSS